VIRLACSLIVCVALAPSAASAGRLLGASFSTIISSTPIVLDSTTATSTLVGNQFSLDAGSWFATSFCIGAAAGCVPRSRPFTPPVNRLELTFGPNGALIGTLGQASVLPTGTPPNGIRGSAKVIGKIGKSPSFTVLVVPINSGSELTTTTPATPTPSNDLTVRVENDAWHLGPGTESGLTLQGFTRPDVMATGSVFVTANGDTVVNLVNLARIRLRGLTRETFAARTFLQLIYAPEPALTGLLGAAALGLGIAGAKRRRRSCTRN